eukprot:TRINITY_DN1497_c0_g1_i2.p1 TRINITY_DN1497_c0_g1~~TRINITY_DN1497_c0_g1_i2.p1  ORF type:complete len:232 (+),score=56.29 TRINITY_DN1497_c0_g1_i2:104-799(+)
MCIRDRLQSERGQDESFQIILRKFLIGFARTEENIAFLSQWFNNEVEDLQNIRPGIEDSWEIVATIFRSQQISRDQKETFFRKQSEKDSSEKTTYYRKQCDGIVANETERDTLWNYYLDKNAKDSATVIGYSMRGFNDRTAIVLNKKFNLRYFNDLESVFKDRPSDYAKKFFHYLVPQHDDLEDIIKSFRQLRTKLPESQSTLIKLIDEQIDRIERKSKVYVLAREYDRQH